MNQPKPFFLLLLSLTFLLACNKESLQQQELPSRLLIGQQSHPFAEGYLENYGSDTAYYEGNNFDLTLVTEGVELYFDGEDGLDSIAGDGFNCYFELFSMGNIAPEDGHYLYHANSRRSGTFDVGAIYEMQNGQIGQSAYSIQSGSLSIARTAEGYVLSGDFEALDGSVISLNYRGPLRSFDYR